MEYISNYWGNLERRFLVVGALIMLLTLPFINNLLPIPLFYSLLAITILSVIAGLTSSSTKKWPIVVDEVISIVGLLIFEYYAVNYYIEYSWMSPLFIVNQILAIDFLLALYYNTKTLREVVL